MVCGAGRVFGGELGVEQPERYRHFSITLRLTDNVNRVQDQSMQITLPASPHPSVQRGGRIQLSQKGSGLDPHMLGDRQSQAIFRALKSSLADYTLAPSTSKLPHDTLMLTVDVWAGDNSATFTFVKFHASQWKKGAEIWNAARGCLQPSQAGSVPTL